MTYRELREQMNSWTDDQLDADLTVQELDGEVFLARLRYAKPTNNLGDVLDEDHPVLASL